MHLDKGRWIFHHADQKPPQIYAYPLSSFSCFLVYSIHESDRENILYQPQDPRGWQG